MKLPKAGDVKTVHINYLTKKFEDFKCVIRIAPVLGHELRCLVLLFQS